MPRNAARSAANATTAGLSQLDSENRDQAVRGTSWRKRPPMWRGPWHCKVQAPITAGPGPLESEAMRSESKRATPARHGRSWAARTLWVAAAAAPSSAAAVPWAAARRRAPPKCAAASTAAIAAAVRRGAATAERPPAAHGRRRIAHAAVHARARAGREALASLWFARAHATKTRSHTRRCVRARKCAPTLEPTPAGASYFVSPKASHADLRALGPRSNLCDASGLLESRMNGLVWSEYARPRKSDEVGDEPKPGPTALPDKATRASRITLADASCPGVCAT